MPMGSIDGKLMSSRDGLRLVAFYRDRLGLPLAEERHGWAGLRPACRLGASTWPSTTNCRMLNGAPIAVSFATDDVDSLVKSLRSAGTHHQQQASTTAHSGRLAAVRDPDGNLIYLHALLIRSAFRPDDAHRNLIDSPPPASAPPSFLGCKPAGKETPAKETHFPITGYLASRWSKRVDSAFPAPGSIQRRRHSQRRHRLLAQDRHHDLE